MWKHRKLQSGRDGSEDSGSALFLASESSTSRSQCSNTWPANVPLRPPKRDNTVDTEVTDTGKENAPVKIKIEKGAAAYDAVMSLDDEVRGHQGEERHEG